MPSRKIEDCVPDLQNLIYAFTARMAKADLPFIITCTARTVREQIALYAQGREKLEQTNYLRKLAGLPAVSFQENTRKVTWTLQSAHLIDLDDNVRGNDKSRAFDIVINRNGKPCWDVKVDVNEDGIPDYEEAGKIAESVGLVWGGRWKTPDRPHFQLG